MYFKKLNLKLDIPSYEIGKKEIEYGFDIDESWQKVAVELWLKENWNY